MKKRLGFATLGVVAVLGLLWAGPVFAGYDIDDDDAGSPTQAGWIATNETGINGVTFTEVCDGVGTDVYLDDRDRVDDNGGGAESDMWRDFIFAFHSVNPDDGMDVTVSGLLADTTYDVTIWGFDALSGVTGGSRAATWTGSGGTSDILTFNGNDDPLPTSLDDYRIDITALADETGELTLHGRANPTYGSTTESNVFINGFELAPAVSHFPGDADGDGDVDADDAARLAAYWLTPTGANWGMGDFNKDGAVNDIDATIMAANWGHGVPDASQAVPEPGTLALLLAGVIMVFVIRRR